MGGGGREGERMKRKERQGGRDTAELCAAFAGKTGLVSAQALLGTVIYILYQK